MAVVANVDTAVGGGEKAQTTNIQPDRDGVQHLSYRRTYQHYLTNDNTSSTPVVVDGIGTTSGGSGAFRSACYKVMTSGWANIPYNSMHAAMTQADLLALTHIAKSFRVVSCGFQTNGLP